MKPGIILPLCLGAFCLAACSSTKPLPDVVKAPTPAFIPIENEANVRIPEQVKAYPFERYIDPTNPAVMHERHVVYRIEQPSTWRLQTSAERQILIGNTLADGRLEKQPLLLPNQLGQQLASTKNSVQQQKEATDEMAKQNQQLLDAVNRTNEAIRELSAKSDSRTESQAELMDSLKRQQDEENAKLRQMSQAVQNLQNRPAPEPVAPTGPMVTPLPKPTAPPVNTDALGL